MTTSTQLLLRQAMQLSSNERAVLIDELIVSLDKPDPSIDAAWLSEAESRLAAYRTGELVAIDAEQVFAALGKSV